MILHPAIDRLRAFADGELTGARRARTARHLERCARCRAEVAWIRDTRAAARDVTALPVPGGAWERIAARRAAGERVIPPAAPAAGGPGPRPSRRLPRHARRAAVLLLAVAGAASATTLAPPLWDRLARALEAPARTAPAPSDPPRESPPAAAGVPADPAAVDDAGPGVVVLPVAGEARLTVQRPDPGLRIRVRLVDAGEMEVRATGAAASAVFHPRRGHLLVSGAGPGVLEVSLPRSVGHVEILVDGRPYLVKDGGKVRLPSSVTDTAGSEFLLPVE